MWALKNVFALCGISPNTTRLHKINRFFHLATLL
jgi:hypothetical protein